MSILALEWRFNALKRQSRAQMHWIMPMASR
jgi:hypothetical protein